MTETGIIEVSEDETDRRIRRLQLGANGVHLAKHMKALDRLLQSEPHFFEANARKSA